ncbi:MAG: hypothetical protein QXM68_02490 [Candidatus Aenigmatarchaeota archaeon]|nr:hypothetical protein [Candidatus Aenigmarchaeota archaeon]
MRVLILLSLILLLATVYALSSPNNHFQVVPEIIRLNWTNNFSSNIYLYINQNGLTVNVMNDTSYLSAYYSQDNSLKTKCQSMQQGHRLVVYNLNESSYNNTIYGSIGDNVTVKLYENHNLDCKPGRYYTNNYVVGVNDTEKVSLNVYVDLPLSSFNNPQLQNDYIASFDGVYDNLYHSYYFNTSLIENASTVNINLTSAVDVDVFLLDSNGQLKTKSINDTSELLTYTGLPENQFWEIRISGNQSSSYQGSVMFNGLNYSNILDFGVLNATQSQLKTVTLTNLWQNQENILSYSPTIYHLDEFTSSKPSNFTFVVPNSSAVYSLKASVESNNSLLLKLYRDDQLVSTSSKKQNIAKNSSVSVEEYVFTTNIQPGIWRLEVINYTPLTTYNVKIYQYFNNMITTNLTTASLNKNEQVVVQANLTIPLNIIDGNYSGYIDFYNSRRSFVRVPLTFNVTTPVLIVNNSFTLSQYSKTHNYGQDTFIQIIFQLNNTGSIPVNVSVTSTNLTNQANYISIYHNTSTYIPAFSSINFPVNITFNSSAPVGNYVGWIHFDSLGKSHPNQNYNITLSIQLTDQLNLNISEIKTEDGSVYVRDPNSDKIVTMRLKAFYINGTEIEAGNELGLNNFELWLEHANVSYRVPSSGNLTISNGTNPLYYNGDYEVNFTVPANKLGGLYKSYARLTWNRNGKVYSGTSYNTSLVINNTALVMIALNSTPSTLPASTTYRFAVNVTNYGEKAKNAYTLIFNESCSGYEIVTVDKIGCTASKTDYNFTFTPEAYSSCIFMWDITTGSENASSCMSGIRAIPQFGWLDPSAINISFKVSTSSSQQVTTTTVAEELQQLQQEEESINYFSVSYPSTFSVEQGKNKSMEIKITNSYSKIQTIKLSLSSINTSWYTVSPTEKTISSGDYYIYRIIFTIPDNADIKDYTGQINVESKYKTERLQFTLKIIPGENLKKIINESLTDFETRIQDLKQFYNSTNETVKSKIDLAENYVKQLRAYVDKGDYSSAYSMLNDVKKLLDDIKITEENVVKPKAAFNWPTTLIASSGFLFVSALGYTVFDTLKKRGVFKVKTKRKSTAKSELKEIKENLKIRELEEEIKTVEEKEKELEEEIKQIKEKEKELESKSAQV